MFLTKTTWVDLLAIKKSKSCNNRSTIEDQSRLKVMSKQSPTLLFKVADLFQISIITNRIKKIKATKSKIYIEKCTMRWEMLVKRQLKRIIT
jgi:hypothetical protein